MTLDMTAHSIFLQRNINILLLDYCLC